MARKSMGARLVIAILAFIGVLVLLDKIAGTHIFDTLYDKFIDLVRQIGEMLGGASS